MGRHPHIDEMIHYDQLLGYDSDLDAVANQIIEALTEDGYFKHERPSIELDLEEIALDLEDGESLEELIQELAFMYAQQIVRRY